MKYVVIALIFLAIGYTIAIFIPPSGASSTDDQNESSGLDATSSNTEDTTSISDGSASSASPDSAALLDNATSLGDSTPGAISVTPSASNLSDPTSLSDNSMATEATTISYVDGSYLTESDLLATPGNVQLVGFRIGPPIAASKADGIIDSLPEPLAPIKARFLTANGKPLVIVIGGQFSDVDLAYTNRASIQKFIKEKLEIIYLPKCIEEVSIDDEGYSCGPPEPEPEASPAS